jgi:ATPase subunit of ABC transporter with duplicated ATPase domains
MEQEDDEISAEALQAETQEAADVLAELQIKVEPSALAAAEVKARMILTGLGFSEASLAEPASSLSGGWKMRAALAVALLSETDILILDEPTNFLDLLGIIWLQRYLQSLEDRPEPPTLILVSHDRDFTSLCTDLLILKDKALTYYHGDLGSFEASQAEKRRHLAKVREAKDKQKAHMQETISRNMREGKKSNDETRIRQAKMRQKKLDDRWGLEENARGGRFKLNRDLAGYHLTSRQAMEMAPEERGVRIILPGARLQNTLSGRQGLARTQTQPDTERKG